MAYAYCDDCGCKMDEPTVQQVVHNDWECENCGYRNVLTKTEGECLLELAERVAQLEAKLSSSK